MKLDELDVNALFNQLETLHVAGALTPSELGAKAAATTRGCTNYWPHRDAQPPRPSRWRLRACARTPGCAETSCLWFSEGDAAP